VEDPSKRRIRGGAGLAMYPDQLCRNRSRKVRRYDHGFPNPGYVQAPTFMHRIDTDYAE
jgi:hypothetical protein